MDELGEPEDESDSYDEREEPEDMGGELLKTVTTSSSCSAMVALPKRAVISAISCSS